MFGANNRYRNIPCEFRNFISRLQKQFCFVVIVSEELLKVFVDRIRIFHRNKNSIFYKL